MTAILLAAGVGRRMGPGAPPKCLLSLGGRSLLRRALEIFRAVGVHRVVLVVGYEHPRVVAEAKHHVRGLPLIVLENPRYREGAILSLWTARESFTDDLLIMDADVLYPQVVLERLVRSPHPNGLLVDGTASDTGEEEMVFGRGERVLQITKRPSVELVGQMTACGESVGFLKISRDAAVHLRRLLEAKVQAGVVDVEHEQVYPELFQLVPVGYERIDGLPWIEIDTREDLARAEREVLPRCVPAPCLNRVMAGWFLPWVARLAVTPNQWTAASLLLGLSAIRCFADGGYRWGLLGAALFQAFYLVDFWDGEVARLKGLSSRWGGWFDVMTDAVVHTALPLGLAAGLVRAGAPPWVSGLGLMAAIGVALDFLVTGWAKHRGFGPAIYGDPSGRDRATSASPRRRWLTVNLTNESFSLLVIAVVLLHWRLPFLAVLAVGCQAYWVRYLWREGARLLGRR